MKQRSVAFSILKSFQRRFSEFLFCSSAGRVCALSWNAHILTSGARDGAIHNHDVRIAEHLTSTYSGNKQSKFVVFNQPLFVCAQAIHKKFVVSRGRPMAAHWPRAATTTFSTFGTCVDTKRAPRTVWHNTKRPSRPWRGVRGKATCWPLAPARLIGEQWATSADFDCKLILAPKIGFAS